MSLRPLRNFMKHRIGLIGFGSMGTNHARIISSLANVNFVGIFDSNIKNTHSSYKFYSSVDQLISDSDLLIIATPTSSHHKFAEYCINKNKHVLVEKLQSELGFPRNQSIEVVESLLGLMKSTLESGDDVLVSGFGKFCVNDKKARKGRNPATG